MRIAFRRSITTCAWLLAGLLAAGGAVAQSWPSKPVQIWHGFSPGANPDVIARTLQNPLAERLGQPVVVDMKPGAGGRIATAFVAKQPADGYSLIMLTGGDGVMAATLKDLPYDLLRDFAFVSTATVFPFMILVPADSPYKTLGDLIADAKKRPGALRYGHSGVASTLHLAGELLAELAGVELTHVPYKGIQVQEVAAGRIEFAVSVATAAVPFIKGGKIRPLAVTSLKRDPKFPDVPAVAEFVPGYEVTSWLGLAAPAGTPQAVVDRLSEDVRAVLAREDVASRIRSFGSDPVAMTSAQYRARVESDLVKWRRLSSRLKLD